jgi:hypothetical protein
MLGMMKDSTQGSSFLKGYFEIREIDWKEERSIITDSPRVVWVDLQLRRHRSTAPNAATLLFFPVMGELFGALRYRLVQAN